MILEIIVGDGDVDRVFGGIDQAISSFGQKAMVDPDVGGAFDVHGVTVACATERSEVGRGEDVVRAGGEDVVDVEVVDDDVGNALDGDLGSALQVDLRAAPVDGLVAGHHELALQLDGHVLPEDDPERLRPRDAVAQRAGRGVISIVFVAGHHVQLPVLAPSRILPESDGARRERLTSVLPVGVAAPAIVDVVPRFA